MNIFSGIYIRSCLEEAGPDLFPIEVSNLDITKWHVDEPEQPPDYAESLNAL